MVCQALFEMFWHGFHFCAGFGRKAELRLDGTPREIFSRVKELKEYRLDVPQVTELAYELKQAGLDLPDGILTMDELMDRLLPMFREKFSEVK